METEQLKSRVKSSVNNELFKLQLDGNIELQIYPDSLNEFEGHLFFIAKEEDEKFLFITSSQKGSNIYNKFEGDEKHLEDFGNQTFIKKCFLNTHNRKSLQGFFEFTIPEVIGLQNSFGFGDRIGLANAGHLRSLDESSFKPILAQQSIRELTRTNRTADEVMDAAVWAVFQEGYKRGFGADADHLKTTDDIDYTVKAGYKMLTFDPSDYVDNKADDYGEEELSEVISDLKWQDLNDSYDESKKRYLKEIRINEELTIKPRETELQRAYSKYGKALIHIKNLYNYVTSNYDNDFDIEVSVDETESVTSIFEHFFIAAELTRLGIKFVSLAPRFIGDFEKGIDYKGDLRIFREEYKKHLAVTKYFGNYKISLHSGSDKFSAYKVIGNLKDGYIHIKTAGTSYLEALKVIAIKQPALFRKILNFSTGLYETEKKTYHVSADVSKVKDGDSYSEDEMMGLFSSNDVRQILHVTFGRVLTEKDKEGEYIFKGSIVKCLKENEETHYKLLIEHFHKHLSPFN